MDLFLNHLIILYHMQVFLTGHVPVGPLSPGLVQWFHPHYVKAFLDLILEYDDVITASHFGHNHGDGFQILQNDSKFHTTTTLQTVNHFHKCCLNILHNCT